MNKYLFFYKDAEKEEKEYLEEHKDEINKFLLKINFDNFVKREFMFFIIDMNTKFDENDNPFTIITYIGKDGEIQYTKFNNEIHKII